MDFMHEVRLFNKLRKLPREKPEVFLFPEHRLGYIQIPKVASRSIRIAMTAFITGSEPGEAVDASRSAAYESHARHLRQAEIAALARDHFIFAFVRNPYARIHSCYRDKIVDAREPGRRNIFAKHGIGLDVSFEEFVRRIAALPDHRSDRHFRSQAWFLTHRGALIPAFVGKLENIVEDWKILQERFGIAPPPIINASRPKPLPDLSDETRALIQVRYADDFRLLGYPP